MTKPVDIFGRIKVQVEKDARRKSMSWYVNKIIDLRTPQWVRRQLLNDGSRQRDTTLVGQMVMFAYDAKWKDKLPVFDRFPLVFPIGFYPDGFLGINLHYLGEGQRYALLYNLMKFASNPKLTKTTRLRISYDVLTSFSKLRSFEPCLKRYLSDHMRSDFVFVHPQEWEIAIHLPTEHWHYNPNKRPRP